MPTTTDQRRIRVRGGGRRERLRDMAAVSRAAGRVLLIGRVPALRRLPELEAIPFGVGSPAETTVRRLLDPLVGGDAGSAQLREHRVEVAHAVVQHDPLFGRAEVLVVRKRDVPDGDVAGLGGEDRAAEGTQLEAQLLCIPGAQTLGIARTE